MSDSLGRIEKLSPKRLLLLALELQGQVDAMKKERTDPIAIVGIGIRVPGASPGADGFWKLLLEGRDAVGLVPKDRWDANAYFDPDPEVPGRMSTKSGSFLEGVDLFDASFFSISRREAIKMDPQQRLLLEVCWEALEHAGHSPHSLSGTPTGVFIGISTSDYYTLLRQEGEARIDGYLASGTAPSIAAGRISYVLGLQGPSMAVDTACSSSLVAVHLACQNLRLGECEMALAGGVNLVLSPDITIALSKAHMMTPDGHCKAFDAKADGFVRGEGCAIVVLKRLSDALRAGDNVLALIRGSAVNQDGHSSGLTAPNGRAQEALLRQALSTAGLKGSEIGYVEAHGTGTALGDPIEAHALASVLGPGRSADNPLIVGSVKTNLGHLEAAAGITGLIKAVLSLKNAYIPKHLHFRRMNPHIDWAGVPVIIPVEGLAWPVGDSPRFAGISSFGFSGTNAHVILEEAPKRTERPPSAERPVHILAISARTPGALNRLVQRYTDELTNTVSELGDFCYTANAGRSHFEYRLAVQGRTATEIKRRLAAGRIVQAETKRHRARPAFVFPPEGSQYPGMGKQLYDMQPIFRRAFDECDSSWRSLTNRSFKDVLWANDASHRLQDAGDALFAVEYALAEMWQSWGIEPAAVFGQGLGQYVAACVAGVHTVSDALKLLIAHKEFYDSARSDGPAQISNRQAEERFHSIAAGLGYKAPRVTLLSASSGEAVGIGDLSAEYWRRQLCQPNIQTTQSALFACGEKAFLEVGPGSTLAQAWQHHLQDVGTSANPELLWVDSLHENRAEWDQILEALGSLYEWGANPDWEAFDHPYRRRRVILPTYPFERSSYWCERQSSKKSSHSTFVNEAESTVDNWFYKLNWPPKPYKSSPRRLDLATRLQSNLTFDRRAQALEVEHGFDRYRALHNELSPVCASYITEALRMAGWDFAIGTCLTVDLVAQRCSIAERHRPLLGRLLEILSEDGVLQQSGNGAWTLACSFPSDHPSVAMCDLTLRYPEFAGELEMTAECGASLRLILQGKEDPINILFPAGSAERVEKIYGDSPSPHVFNGIVADIVRSEIGLRPNGDIRLLEVGAGTGSTTRHLVSFLPEKRTTYFYTDVSSSFTVKAATKFGKYPFVRYQSLDIEKDPAKQGFEPGQIDIVLAANVLHATSDLRTTVRHIRDLLSPGGRLIILEGTYPERWVDLTFGLTEGWWRFADYDLRPSYPLISRQAWLDLLVELGFDETGAVQLEGAQQVVFHARKPQLPVKSKRYLIVPDHLGVADECVALLKSDGAAVDVAESGNSLITRLRSDSYDYVLHLATLDCPRPEVLDADLLARWESGVMARVLTTVKAVTSTPGSARIWLITSGAESTGAEDQSDPNLLQAPVWGFARNIVLEHPRSWGGLLDLDPDDNPHNSAVHLLSSIAQNDGEDEIAIRHGNRCVARLERNTPPPSLSPSFDPDKVFIITGGLGVLGLNLARWMVGHGARRLVLLSRSGLPDRSAWNELASDGQLARRIAALIEVEALGADVQVVKTDVCDLKQVSDLFGTFSPGEIKGIFHLAANVSGALIKDMAAETISSVFAPKIMGTWNLHQVSRQHSLDFFVMFSSWASILGGRRLAHYAAANHFLDAFAFYRSRLGLPALVVNWASWDDMNAGSNIQEEYARGGLLPMRSDLALESLGRLMAAGATQAIIAAVNWTVHKPLHESHAKRPILEHIELDQDRNGRVPQGEFTEPRIGSLGMPTTIDRMQVYLLDVFASLLGVETPAIDCDRPTTDFGLDSIIALEFKNRIASDWGAEVPTVQLLQGPSLTELSSLIFEKMGSPTGDAHGGLPHAVDRTVEYPLSYGQRAVVRT